MNNATTINSSLNVVGNIIGSGTALTKLNYNAIFNRPTFLVSLNNPSTFISTLTVSGSTILNNSTTINSPLNILRQLTLATSSGNNPWYISSTATNANNSINIKNNSTFNAYIGVGAIAFGGNYQIINYN